MENKDKTITLTESQLLEIVYKGVKKALNEMSMHRQDYMRKVDDLFRQIAENWCLVDYFKHNAECNVPTLKHWANELSAYLNKLYDITLKRGDKYKATCNVLIDQYEYNTHPEYILHQIEGKFSEEDIEESPIESAKHFADELPYLCKLISNTVNATPNEYVHNLLYSIGL